MVLNRQCGRICRKKKRLPANEPAVSHADQLVLVFNLRPIRIVDIGLDLISICCLGFRSASPVFSFISRRAAALAVSSSSIPPPCGHLRLLPLRPCCGTAGAPSRRRRASAHQRRLLPYQIISEALRTRYGAGGWLYRLSVSDRYGSWTPPDRARDGHNWRFSRASFDQAALLRYSRCEPPARRTAQRSSRVYPASPNAAASTLYRFKTHRMAPDLGFVRSATRPGSTLPLAVDEHPVGALGSCAAYPSLSETVRARGSRRVFTIFRPSLAKISSKTPVIWRPDRGSGSGMSRSCPRDPRSGCGPAGRSTFRPGVRSHRGRARAGWSPP